MSWKRLGVAGVAVLGAAAGTAGTWGSGENVGFDPKTVTVGEGDGAAVVTVARDACETGSFRYFWSAPRTTTHWSTATEGEDYVAANSTGTWSRCDEGGRDTKVFTVPIIDDDEAEPDENIEMSLGAGRTSTSSTNPLPSVDPDGEIVIEDDDQLRLVATGVRVREADGVARVTVERRRGDGGDTGEPMTLSWETADGSAKAGADYVAQSAGEVEIPAGESRATVSVPVKADAAVEGDEDFRVRFAWGVREATATVTIADSTQQAASQQQQQPVIVLAPRALQASPKGPCLSKRRFTVRLRGVRRGTVRLDGKRLKTRRRGGSLVATVNLRGRLKGEYVLTVNGRTKSGRKVTETRTYRTCAPKRQG